MQRRERHDQRESQLMSLCSERDDAGRARTFSIIFTHNKDVK
jgi:hypothetical protein